MQQTKCSEACGASKQEKDSRFAGIAEVVLRGHSCVGHLRRWNRSKKTARAQKTRVRGNVCDRTLKSRLGCAQRLAGGG